METAHETLTQVAQGESAVWLALALSATAVAWEWIKKFLQELQEKKGVARIALWRYMLIFDGLKELQQPKDSNNKELNDKKLKSSDYLISVLKGTDEGYRSVDLKFDRDIPLSGLILRLSGPKEFCLENKPNEKKPYYLRNQRMSRLMTLEAELVHNDLTALRKWLSDNSEFLKELKQDQQWVANRSQWPAWINWIFSFSR